MLNKKIYKYLTKRNRELEKKVAEYEKDTKRVKELSDELSALKSEWAEKLDLLKKTQAEYTALMRDVKVAKAELVKACKRMEGNQ